MINRELIDKEIKLEGNIKKFSNPYIIVESAKFECPSCGYVLSVIQYEEKLKEPERCACGRKTGFKVISKELHEQQDFIIQVFGTNEEIKIYICSKELIEKFSKRRVSKIFIKGILKDEFKKKLNKGVLVVYAEDINFEMKGGMK